MPVVICPMTTSDGRTVYVSVNPRDAEDAIAHLDNSQWVSTDDKARADNMGTLTSTGEFLTVEEFMRRQRPTV